MIEPPDSPLRMTVEVSDPAVTPLQGWFSAGRDEPVPFYGLLELLALVLVEADRATGGGC